MSGDVQPRKRKDKKKKRDSLDSKGEGETFIRKISSKDDEDLLKESHHHGVHSTKMGSDDVHLHVQSDHGTGGHWFAKIFFFALLAILLGLIGLIIMENRGLQDLDTPLSESRYSEYFQGWVDEHREGHDDHDEVDKIVSDIESHDEPFEENDDTEENHNDDEHGDDDDEQHNDDHEDEEEANSEEEQTEENNSEVENEEEDEESEDIANEDADDTNASKEEEEENDEVSKQDNDEDEDVKYRGKREISPNEDSNDEDNEDNADTEEEANDVTKDEEDEKVDEDTKEEDNNETAEDEGASDDFDEIEDDGGFESLEKIVDNDADEILHLQEKAEKKERERLQQERENKASEPAEDEEEQTQSSSQINPNERTGGAQEFDEDSFIEEELQRANEEMLRNNLQAALNIFESISIRYPDIPEAHYGKAKILDRLSEVHRSNEILIKAIDSYKRFLSFEELLDNKTFIEAAERCINRMRFKGLNLQAVNIHNMLIKRFPNEPQLRNELAVTYLLINRLPEAKIVLNETLSRWENDGFALVHFGFILKNLDKDLEKAVLYLKAGLETNAKGTNDGRFFFNLGDALQRLGRNDEAIKVYREGASRGLFLSEYQRSLYNVETLKSRPFWTKKETTYQKYLQVFEDNWKKIREEGFNALNEKGYFVDEAENLKDIGDWKQLELFAKGYKNKKNCMKAPFTCKLIEMFPAARFCKRGQTKFSIIHPNTHVWPHCGPTNCRLRAHLGLKVPPGVRIRVATEERSWKEGKFLIFDDSFEHEVWHNGTAARLVLIIDVWHPDLSDQQKQSLSPI